MLELLALADRIVSPAVLIILVLIYARLSSAIISIQKLEGTLERTITNVSQHATAIARLEGWLERHGHKLDI